MKTERSPASRAWVSPVRFDSLEFILIISLILYSHLMKLILFLFINEVTQAEMRFS